MSFDYFSFFLLFSLKSALPSMVEDMIITSLSKSYIIFIKRWLICVELFFNALELEKRKMTLSLLKSVKYFKRKSQTHVQTIALLKGRCSIVISISVEKRTNRLMNPSRPHERSATDDPTQEAIRKHLFINKAARSTPEERGWVWKG